MRWENATRPRFARSWISPHPRCRGPCCGTQSRNCPRRSDDVICRSELQSFRSLQGLTRDAAATTARVRGAPSWGKPQIRSRQGVKSASDCRGGQVADRAGVEAVLSAIQHLASSASRPTHRLKSSVFLTEPNHASSNILRLPAESAILSYEPGPPFFNSQPDRFRSSGRMTTSSERPL